MPRPNLIEHIELFAGGCTGAELTTVRGANRGYDIAFYGGEQMTTCVSNGLRFQDLVPAVHTEVVCSVLTDQAEAGRYLVDVVSDRVVGGGVMPPLGTLMLWDSPLFNGTQITALVTGLHPYFGAGFNLFEDEQNGMQIHLLTLIPATASEVAFAQAHSVQALGKRWETDGTPLFDVERAPVV